ncbi:MAG: hypothetical protein IKR04_04165 [Clostridia bacterium]|nr:hypothetical protein [Clostridia bacterium]
MNKELVLDWLLAKELMEQENECVEIDCWLKKLKPLLIDEDNFYFEASSLYQKRVIEKRYKKLMELALLKVTGNLYDVKIEVLGSRCCAE